MSPKALIGIIIAFVLIILYLLVFWRNQLITWLNTQWFDLLLAVILAIFVGIVLNYMYKKYSSKSKMLKTTITPSNNTHHSLAKLVLKENQEFIIKEYERVFGREDFIGVTVPDDLLYVGKEHFKITKQNDGFYIEDLNSKNGTQINGEEIKGKGKRKLKNEDNILLAQTLNIKYYDE
jgi:FHA domain